MKLGKVIYNNQMIMAEGQPYPLHDQSGRS